MAGLVIVFKSYNFRDGIFGSKWVGLRNFRFLVSDFHNAWRATTNTVILNVLFIVFGTLFAVAIAIMMNEIGSKGVRKVSQSVMFFPYFLSWVAMRSIFQMFLSDNGIFNDILSMFSIAPVSWYSTPGAWRPILVIVNLIKNTGYNSIIYFAALTGFDTSYYEAMPFGTFTGRNTITGHGNHEYSMIAQDAEVGENLHIAVEAYAGHYVPGCQPLETLPHTALQYAVEGFRVCVKNTAVSVYPKLRLSRRNDPPLLPAAFR